MNATECHLSNDFVNSISQLSHFAWGSFIVMLIPIVFQARMITLPTWLLFNLYAAIKEGVYDPMFEACDISSWDWEDFVIYVSGSTFGLLVMWWRLPQLGSMNPLMICHRICPDAPTLLNDSDVNVE